MSLLGRVFVVPADLSEREAQRWYSRRAIWSAVVAVVCSITSIILALRSMYL